MDRRLWLVFVVLNVFVNGPVLVDGEDVSEPCVIVERVAVDVERRLLRGEDEDCPRLGL